MPVKTAASNGTAAIEKIVLPEIDQREAFVTVEGITPLIVHNWSAKAKRQMLDKQMGKASAKKKDPKVPQEDFESSLYVVKGCEKWPLEKQGRYFYPAAAFKAAMVRGCTQGSNIPMTIAKMLVFIPENPVLTFDELEMREDMVRLETGVADIRYRGQFNGWGAKLRVQYNAGMLTLEQLVNMVNLGGFHAGIGEWRPSAKKSYNGEYGRFRVVGQVEA